MDDNEFRQLVERVLAAHDTRHADHEARMAAHDARIAIMDRNYDKLLELQIDLARSHDEHEGRMDQLRRMQQALARSHERHEEQMELMRATFEAIKDILRERRNEGTW